MTTNYDMLHAESDFENRVILNVGGTRFETYKTILKKIPATRLSRLTEALVNYDPVTNEYFFDRHPGVFSQILNYYRTGKLHYPINVCGPLFEEELEFWGLDSNQVEPCCWKTYTKHRFTEETLAALDRLNIDVDRTPKSDLMIKFGIDEHRGFRNNRISYFQRIKPIVWQLFEEHRSSKPAMTISVIHIAMVILSVAILWISPFSELTYQVVEMNNQIVTSNNTLEDQKISFRLIENSFYTLIAALDYVTVAWFIVEISIRMIVSPNKAEFFHNIENIVEILATSWSLVYIVLQFYVKSFFLQSIQVVRVFRLFRLSSYHTGLRVIVSSVMTSAKVLQLLVFFMIVSSTLYGSLIFYAERLTTSDPDNNIFISIIDAFWYALVSLTTIGYGDYSPKTTLGRLFGSACVLTGVIMVGLPMTIVVEVFTNFYKHLGARSQLPKQRRRILPVEAPRLRKRAHTSTSQPN